MTPKIQSHAVRGVRIMIIILLLFSYSISQSFGTRGKIYPVHLKPNVMISGTKQSVENAR